MSKFNDLDVDDIVEINHGCEPLYVCGIITGLTDTDSRVYVNNRDGDELVYSFNDITQWWKPRL